MNDALVEMFKHNLWANLRLIDACAGLSDEQLAASTQGTFGAVCDTLLHILVGEQYYLMTFTGRQPADSIRPRDGFPGFEVLRQRVRQSGEELIEVASQIQPTEPLRGTLRGEPFTLPAAILLTQALTTPPSIAPT